MPAAISFRQVDEKHLPADVELMMWSPKMDLIAVSNVVGEVTLHRLSWQKVWTLAPHSETTKVSSLAWRPDGKVLAVGYDNGRINFCDVENFDCLHSLDVDQCVTFLGWLSEVKQNSSSSEDDISGRKELFEENLSTYLPKLPPLSKSYETGKRLGERPPEDAKKLEDQAELNILIIGMEIGVVKLFAFGVFPLGTLHLDQHIHGQVGKIISAHFSENLSFLTIVAEDLSTPARLQICNFDTSIFSTYSQELRILALKFGRILTLDSYMDSTLNQMSEAWEDILLEMDSKLNKFAEEKSRIGGGSVSRDFLKLLMFGTPSDELKNFLTFDLTDKGLKKLGHSIENSYSNIQKLLLRHFQSVAQAILCHLSDVKGMALWPEKFGVLGLCVDETLAAINRTGSLLLKASELQQVIEGSMKNFKAFFRWLYVVILRLSEESIPPALNKMSQQDLSFVAQFLHDNFTEVEPSKCSFRLERVGQYLRKEDLANVIDNSGNPWQKFLQNSPAAASSPYLYKTFPEKSLAQMSQMLHDMLNGLLHRCADTIQKSFNFISAVSLADESVDCPFTTHISQCNVRRESEAFIYTAFCLKNTKSSRFFICRQSTQKSLRYQMDVMSVEPDQIKLPKENTERQQIKNLSNCLILDLSFYDNQMLSLLLQEDCENGRPILLQVLVASLEGLFRPFTGEHSSHHLCVPLSNISNKATESIGCVEGFRVLENMKASKLAVSGTRKVSCVLFLSRRRVRLFLMDVEDEDDDTAVHIDISQEEEAINAAESPSSLTVEVDEENKENTTS